MKSNSKTSNPRARAALLLSLGALCGAGLMCSAATIPVKNLNNSGPGSLRQAIASAMAGDTVVFQVSGKITLTSGSLNVTQPITIAAPGANLIEVNGNDWSRVFDITTPAGTTTTLKGLTIAHGLATVEETMSYPSGGGGGIANEGHGNLWVIYCGIQDNRVNGGRSGINGKPYGAGIFSRGFLGLRGCTITRNYSTFEGGGIAVIGGGQIVDCDINQNQAAGYGGGIIVADSQGGHSVSIYTSNISDNTAVGGGGVASQGYHTYITIGWSALVNNFATNPSNDSDEFNLGGGLFLEAADCSINDSTISGNESFYVGGGIAELDGSLKMRNVTIYNNTDGPVASVNSLPDPHVTGGGGIYADNSACQIQNCIIAGNWFAGNGGPVQNDIQGTMITLGHNLIQNALNVPFMGNSVGDIVFQDPKLAPLGCYGGFTMTHALYAGSPAIDAGATVILPFNAIPTDQRGVPRPVGLGWDIGAFEGSVFAPPGGH